MEAYRQLTENVSPIIGKKHFPLHIATGITYLALGFINYYVNNENIFLAAIWFLGGMGFIITAIVQKNRAGKYYVELNDNGIDANLSQFKSVNIKWNEIKLIEIKPLSIVFNLEDNSNKEILLSVWNYASVKTIKAKLNEFANENGIEIR
jgi:hypothetical protein